MNTSTHKHCEGIEYAQSYPATAATQATQKEPETIICLHGIGGDDNSFSPQLEKLSNKFLVIAWNMPGYKNSEPLDVMSFDTLSDSLLGFIQSLGLHKVHLVGQSIGGMIAIEATLKAPEKISSLSLIATTSAFGGRDDSFKNAFLKARLTPLEQGQSMQQLAKQFVPEIVGDQASKQAIESAVESMAALSSNVYKQVLGCLVQFNRRVEIQQLQCPVCLIAGEQDNNAPAPTMQKMATKISGAQFHCVLGAGHLVNLEKAKETNDILQQFLEKSIHAR